MGTSIARVPGGLRKLISILTVLSVGCSVLPLDPKAPKGDVTPQPKDQTITWTTDEPATGVVEMGTASGEYHVFAYQAGEKYRTQHEVSLVGLEAGTTYYYRVRSILPDGEIVRSGETTITAPETSAPTMTVSMIDISDRSPGDSILVEAPQANILIDGGGEDAIARTRSFVRDRGIQYVDFAFVTHDHWDHASALTNGLAGDLDVQGVVVPWKNVRETFIDDLRSYTETYQLPFYGAHRGDNTSNAEYLFWGYDVNVEMVSAGVGTELMTGHESTDINNDSLVMKVSYGDASFLFTGDAENEANAAYVLDENDGYDVDVDVLKVNHHGRRDAVTKALVQATSPSLALISTHNDGLLQHEVLWDLEDENTDVFRIDLPDPNLNREDENAVTASSNLILVTDGHTITARYEQ